MTNKDDWVVYPEEIAKRMGIHRNTVDKHIKELAKAGYARITKKSLGRGKGVDVQREFSDRKIFVSQNL